MYTIREHKNSEQFKSTTAENIFIWWPPGDPSWTPGWI